ncbi:MAG: pimeloyl-ACP methyl ester carboxylesterase/membrane protein DedA with SNARE-associated domain [Planctomycetota bacterium]|jgi:pimeloyl-ACP methyl ester carboxylesterase/membrane protein DedA with SNARE-associated domain
MQRTWRRSERVTIPATTSKRKKVAKLLLGLWLVSLIASHLWWRTNPSTPEMSPGDQQVLLTVVLNGERGREKVRMSYRAFGSSDEDATTLMLLHGSPGTLQDFDQLAALFSPELRILVPDLPGFGKSEKDLPDYSARAHAIYLAEFIELQKNGPVHLVAFSMGGAIASELADYAPELVASIMLASALGVEELELFGNHELNHLIHGAQLTAIEALRWILPHFGSADRWVLGRSYARNFYDTDQSRIRGCLERFQGPMRILHGKRDFLVPIEAARESARIVPQSELIELDASHFILWTQTELVAKEVEDFVDRVKKGNATTRSMASSEREEQAALTFDPASVPPASGPTLLLLMLLFVIGTLISEDLTTIAAGLLVAQGRLDFMPAAFACSFGVYIGDMGLFLAGRWLGRPVVERRPLSWFLTPAALERASAWFQKQGVKTIFLSRLMPGLRLPTYFAAGVLKTPFSTFAFYFFLAVIFWTPLLLGFSAWVGTEALEVIEEWGFPAVVGLLISLVLFERVVLRLFTFRGRRSLRGSWIRLTSWEFWPPTVFYSPIVIYILWLAIKHRSLVLFTAVNPSIPTGGFIGESKMQILAGLDQSSGFMARHQLVSAKADCESRERAALDLLSQLDQPYPVVLKPDVGQRGSGVRIIKSEEELLAALGELTIDHILQEFVSGPEFGVFYIRRPNEERGRIFSITKKVFPYVVGDGTHTLEELILLDPRAVAMAPVFLETHAAQLSDVPLLGEQVQLVELGTHCRGAIFVNGAELNSPELLSTFETLSNSFEGFYFGRYDVRAESEEAFRAGRGFKVLELNGVTSEATHIYDPRTPLFEAWRVLFEQWRIAFEIGAANRLRGAKPASAADLLAEYRAYRRNSVSHKN